MIRIDRIKGKFRITIEHEVWEIESLYELKRLVSQIIDYQKTYDSLNNDS